MAEAAAVIGCHPVTIRKVIKAGKLPAFWLGKKMWIAKVDLKEYRKRQAVRPA